MITTTARTRPAGASTVVAAVSSTQWERKNKDQIFTADEVFAAWMKGRQDGLRDDLKAKLKIFDQNTILLFDLLQDIYRFLEDRNLIAFGAFLKPESWSVFRMLVVVDEDTYLSDAFFSVFPFVQQKETEIAAKNVCHASVTFVDAKSLEDVDGDHLVSDGYELYHDKSSEASGA